MLDPNLTSYANVLLNEMGIETPASVYRNMIRPFVQGRIRYKNTRYRIDVAPDTDGASVINHECGHAFIMEKLPRIQKSLDFSPYNIFRRFFGYNFAAYIFPLVVPSATLLAVSTNHRQSAGALVVASAVYSLSLVEELMAELIGRYFSKQVRDKEK